jgi:hypothetical protein
LSSRARCNQQPVASRQQVAGSRQQAAGSRQQAAGSRQEQGERGQEKRDTQAGLHLTKRLLARNVATAGNQTTVESGEVHGITDDGLFSGGEFD